MLWFNSRPVAIFVCSTLELYDSCLFWQCVQKQCLIFILVCLLYEYEPVGFICHQLCVGFMCHRLYAIIIMAERHVGGNSLYNTTPDQWPSYEICQAIHGKPRVVARDIEFVVTGGIGGCRYDEVSKYWVVIMTTFGFTMFIFVNRRYWDWHADLLNTYLNQCWSYQCDCL